MQPVLGTCGGQCTNGCCRLITCLNGGKCVEKCDDVKRKFVCNCPPLYTGKLCETKKPSSCAELTKLGKPSGIHSITLPSGQDLKVYCDFNTEPGFVWTLIESFAYEKNVQFQEKPFPVDFPVNPGSPDWKEYRMSHNHMMHIKSHATLWRATCKYDTDGLQKIDYMTGLLSQTDIFAYTSASVCRRVRYINIRGQSCTDCTTHYNQMTSRHAYVDSHYGKVLGCDWNASPGHVYGQTSYGSSWDDNFGYYMIRNPNHRCSSSSSSTTQWWLGIEV